MTALERGTPRTDACFDADGNAQVKKLFETCEALERELAVERLAHEEAAIVRNELRAELAETHAAYTAAHSELVRMTAQLAACREEANRLRVMSEAPVNCSVSHFHGDRRNCVAFPCGVCGKESCYGVNGLWFCLRCWLAR